jgi:hypothetical protein
MDLIEKLTAATTEPELTAALNDFQIDPKKLISAAAILKENGNTVTPECIAAVSDAGVPADAIDAYFEALQRWHALVNRRAISDAFEHAQHLMDTLGEEHPETMRAVMKALELQDPGVCDRILRESGFDLPATSYVNSAGVRMFALCDVATSLGVSQFEVLEKAAELGVGVGTSSDALHRVH